MNREKNGETGTLKAKMVNAANMPKDVLFGVPIVTLTGQLEICIENYRGIIEYTEMLVRIKTKIGQIKVIGKDLQIEYYTNDEMKVTGRIASVEYS